MDPYKLSQNSQVLSYFAYVGLKLQFIFLPFLAVCVG